MQTNVVCKFCSYEQTLRNIELILESLGESLRVWHLNFDFVTPLKCLIISSFRFSWASDEPSVIQKHRSQNPQEPKGSLCCFPRDAGVKWYLNTFFFFPASFFHFLMSFTYNSWLKKCNYFLRLHTSWCKKHTGKFVQSCQQLLNNELLFISVA